MGCVRICTYVEKHFGRDVAGRVARELLLAFERIALHPDIGHRRDDLTGDRRIRFWPVGPTLIAYRAGPAGVEVLFVERGGIDWESKLLEGP